MKLYIVRFDSVDYAVLAGSVSEAVALWVEDWKKGDDGVEYDGEEPDSIELMRVEKILGVKP